MKPLIQVIGDIDHDMYARFSSELLEYEKAGEKEVIIELCSDGGSATVALAFFSRIRGCSCKINIAAVGLVASAAVLILAAGQVRKMTKEAWVMVHEDDIPDVEGKLVHEAEKITAHLRRMEVQWDKLLASVTSTSEGDWAALHKAETYLTAEECLKLGLIEEIL